ncbi:MAG: hypothetical protein AAGC68_14495, partial [Verrucomicrobiota bacterium]
KNDGATVTWFQNPGPKLARELSKWRAIPLADASWIMSLTNLSTPDAEFLLYSDRKPDSQGIYLIPLLEDSPWFSTPVRIAASEQEVMFLDLAHLDDDELLDIAVAIRPNRISVFYQPESPLSPWVDSADLDPLLSDHYGTAKAVRIGDLDGDDLPDFAISCERANGRREGAFVSNLHSEFTPVSGPEGVKFDHIELVDLDEDGDLDFLTTEESKGLGVIWYENPLR